MKRYKVVARTRDVGPGYAELRENPDGEVVKYEDVEKLVELNREMVESLKAINGIRFQIEYGGMVQIKRIIKSVLYKAEGVNK